MPLSYVDSQKAVRITRGWLKIERATAMLVYMLPQQKFLKQYLLQLLANAMSEEELTSLVHLSRSIVQAHLQRIRFSISQLCEQQGITALDLAYDCLGEVFARNQDNRFPHIDAFEHSLNQPLAHTPDPDLFLAFKQFLVTFAETQLAKLYALNDPTGARIHRCIKEYCKTSSCFTLTRDFRGLVLQPSNSDPGDHGEAYPLEELEREILRRGKVGEPVPKVLSILHSILRSDHPYRRSVPLVDIVRIFKHYYRITGRISGTDILDDEPTLNFTGLMDFEIDSIRRQVETTIKEKIVTTYLLKGKVDKQQAEAMYSALHDMTVDWCTDRSDPSLFEYFSRHYPIDEERYEAEFRTKMEYLLKITRETFAAHLMREL